MAKVIILLCICTSLVQVLNGASTRVPISEETTPSPLTERSVEAAGQFPESSDSAKNPADDTKHTGREDGPPPEAREDRIRVPMETNSGRNVKLPSKNTDREKDEDIIYTESMDSECRLVDLALIVDSSGSIKDNGEENWNITIRFLRDLIGKLPVGLNQTRVGLVKFSSEGQVWFHLDKYGSRMAIDYKISDLPYSGSWTNTQEALHLMRTEIFQTENGDRPEYANIAIVMTDGMSNIVSHNTIPEAQRAMMEGVQIFVVGVTNLINRTELEGIASKKEWVYHVENFTDLDRLVFNLTNDICHVPINGSWEEWTPWSSCPVTCGSGVVTRTRVCDGSGCLGPRSESVSCEAEVECPDPIPPWGPWGPCSVTCGEVGWKRRSRGCGDQPGCTEPIQDSARCFPALPSCPDPNEWGPWQGCTHTCGGGVRARSRNCQAPGCSRIVYQTQRCAAQPCTEWGSWGEWELCTATCGGGTRGRRRAMLNPLPGGPREERITVTCSPLPCPIEWMPWGEWGICSKTCDGGFRERTRVMDNPLSVTPISEKQTETCSTQPCLQGWTEWGPCNVTCGKGVRARTRGTEIELGDCLLDPCAVIEWGPWEPWGRCSQTCGVGQMQRKRTRGDGESESDVQIENSDCELAPCPEWTGWTVCSVTCGSGQRERTRGEEKQTEACIIVDCPPEWSQWTDCSATCGGGQRKRSRGEEEQVELCNLADCPPEWSQWTECSATCGGGQRKRSRGEEEQVELCNLADCPPEWSPWTDCSATCGGGQRKRSRGEEEQSEHCNLDVCPPEWSEWTACSVTCGQGQQIRQRGVEEESKTCNTGECPPEWTEWGSCNVTCGGGLRARTRGTDLQFEECSSNPCPVWTEWEDCSVTCGVGVRRRLRGDEEQTEACSTEPCSEWTEWGACNVTCGTGTRARTRGTEIDIGECPMTPCPVWTPWSECSVTCGDGERRRTRGEETMAEMCSGPPCPEWGPWQPWGTCSATCGGGVRRRTSLRGNGASESDRKLDIEPCGTDPCPEWTPWSKCSATCGDGNRIRTKGSESESEACNDGDCPAFGEWTVWSNCSVTCGRGFERRTRVCLQGVCEGEVTRTRACVRPVCPGPDMWAGWTEWGRCSVTCGPGTRSRSRSCTPGDSCIGSANQTGECQSVACRIPPCNQLLDLALVIDSSGSINDKDPGNWDRVLNFIIRQVNALDVGPDKVKVALIKFSNQAKVWFTLNTHMDEKTAAPAIKNLPYSGGRTNTQAALQLLRTEVFVRQNGDRSNIPNAVLLFTDGESNVNQRNTIPEANKVKADGTTIMVVGVTNQTNEDELRGIASKDEYVFYEGNFTDLPDILEPLINQTCRDDIWGEWEPWIGCSESCDNGTETRVRKCLSMKCDGQTNETRDCACPEKVCSLPSETGRCRGSFEKYFFNSASSKCEKFVYGGCDGNRNNFETIEECTEFCDIMVNPYGSWSEWSDCSVTCGLGSETRQRTCRLPPCKGETTETRACVPGGCPGTREPLWGPWSFWSTCNVSCGPGTSARVRRCLTESRDVNCPGASIQTETCAADPC